jgi:hypothetical protein
MTVVAANTGKEIRMRINKAMRQDVIRQDVLNFMAIGTEAVIGFDSNEENMMAPPL